MVDDGLDPRYVRIRRAGKAISDETWIKNFLRQAPVGVLATVFQDQPFLSTKLFVFEEKSHVIYTHSADEGRVMENIIQNPKVCFTVYEMGRLLPSPKARGFGVEYKSVVVFGKVHIVEDANETLRALRLVMEKYAPQFQPDRDYPAIQLTDLHGLVVYRLEISAWSAKQDFDQKDNVGAYYYEDVVG